ncbi:MAG: response regulator [Lachnospiraceae bacterium]|nr:response regulator [Lachnospiraceae bacterium]
MKKETELRREIEELEIDLFDIYESSEERYIKSSRLIKLGKEIGDDRVIGAGHYQRCVYYFARNEKYHLFKDEALKCIECLKDTGANTYLTSVYLLLGSDAANYGQTNLNIDYFLLAQHYSDLEGDVGLQAMVDYYLCGFYITIGEIKTALSYGLRSVERAKQAEGGIRFFGSDRLDMTISMLGQCYVWLGDYDKVLECYEVSKERETCYIPRYDCPNTALLYVFHIMALHVSGQDQKRDEECEEFICLMKKHQPAPPFFLHIINITLFLMNHEQYKYAREILPFLISTNSNMDNPNFDLYISNIKIRLAKVDGDEKAYQKALEEHYIHSGANSQLLLKNMQTSVNLRMEMERVQAEVQEERNELEVARKANEVKSNFLSNMSHEIRTPLNAILGMDEIIMRETTDDEIYRHASDIKSAGQTLLGLINDILDSSKLEAGKIDIIPVEYDITSLINDLNNMIRQRAENKGLEFEIKVTRNVPFLLYGDEIRIKQCVINILTNAVKYTERGKVTLEVTSRKATEEELLSYKDVKFKNAKGEDVSIDENFGSISGSCPIVIGFKVFDTGIGIKEEDMEKLFARFERIEESRNRTIEGTGLGMNIVQGLLSLMNTHLEVESEYGKGSTFSFELIQGARSCELLGDYTKHLNELSEKRVEYRPKLVAPKAKILVVDDTLANLTVVKGLLKSTKIRVDTVTSGKETLEAVKKEAYDLLMIDQRMPEMDGIETLHALKELEGNLSIEAPCVALTANAISGAREMFLKEGFDDYLTKPIDSEKMELTILRLLPKELIGSEKESEDASDADGDQSPKENQMLEEKLSSISELDFLAGLNNCGESLEILKDTMTDFVQSSKEVPQKISSFQKMKDYHNYTIIVHGLKSAARFIGALHLSDLAAELEAAGDAENEAIIEEKTGNLLQEYKELGTKLGEVLGLNEGLFDDAAPPIETSHLQEIYGGILEFSQALDFDMAEEIFDMLREYSLPKEEQIRAQKIYEAIRNVDKEKIENLLK